MIDSMTETKAIQIASDVADQGGSLYSDYSGFSTDDTPMDILIAQGDDRIIPVHAFTD